MASAEFVIKFGLILELNTSFAVPLVDGITWEKQLMSVIPFHYRIKQYTIPAFAYPLIQR